MSIVPGTADGDTAVIWLELLTVTDAAATPPKFTVAPETKFAPVIVTDVPPLVGPDAVEMLETAGPEVKVY
jgi:hypothetical protein